MYVPNNRFKIYEAKSDRFKRKFKKKRQIHNHSRNFFEHLFILETERAGVWVIAGRGRGRESQADSLLSTEPDRGLNPTTLRS